MSGRLGWPWPRPGLAAPSADAPAPQEPPTQPAGPSEVEALLQAEAEKLRAEVASLAEQLHTQVCDNQSLSQLNAEQGQRLLQLEREAEVWDEQAEARSRILETMENDRTTITRALAQNRELKQQLAELQDGFVKLVRPGASGRDLPAGKWAREARGSCPAGRGSGWGGADQALPAEQREHGGDVCAAVRAAREGAAGRAAGAAAGEAGGDEGGGERPVAGRPCLRVGQAAGARQGRRCPARGPAGV